MNDLMLYTNAGTGVTYTHMHDLKPCSEFGISKISYIYLDLIWYEKMKNIREQYTVLFHITVPNNVEFKIILNLPFNKFIPSF